MPFLKNLFGHRNSESTTTATRSIAAQTTASPKGSAESGRDKQPWMIGSATVKLAISKAAIDKLGQRDVPPLSAATIILAIERRDLTEFAEAESGTLQLTASALAEASGMWVYRDAERESIPVTDRQIDQGSKYAFIGWLNTHEYAHAKCRALGLDTNRLRVR